MLNLNGRVAVMAGATGHQGEGVVQALTEAGMRVVMVTHNPGPAQELIQKLGKWGELCTFFSNEMSDVEVMASVYEQYGSVDVIIPNQGSPGKRQALLEITQEDFARKYNHYVWMSFSMVQAALPYLKRSKAGRIILMSDLGGMEGALDGGLCDCAAKGGVIAMTRYLARELAGDHITCNCIIKAGLEDDHIPREGLGAKAMIPRIPEGRNGRSEEFGAMVQYLASEEAGYVTGQLLELSGGMHA